jgi:hypothetical protein
LVQNTSFYTQKHPFLYQNTPKNSFYTQKHHFYIKTLIFTSKTPIFILKPPQKRHFHPPKPSKTLKNPSKTAPELHRRRHEGRPQQWRQACRRVSAHPGAR